MSSVRHPGGATTCCITIGKITSGDTQPHARTHLGRQVRQGRTSRRASSHRAPLEICEVQVEPANRPIFATDEKGQHLFIRSNNQTVALSMEESWNYSRVRWSG